MKYLKAPGDLMTWNMEQHKNTGTSGEDWIWKNIEMKPTTQMTKPCVDMVKIGDEWFSDGTYKEFFHGTMNGYKFSCYTCHCEDFVTVGDNYAGSTGLHIHLLCFHGHQTQEYMQQNRNTKGVTLAEIDAKCVPQNTTTTPPTTSTPKEYVEAKRSGKSSYNGTFKFDVKYYEELKDLCNQKDIYDLDDEKWLAGTTWTSVKKVGSSSSSSIKTYRRTHGNDQGYYKIDTKYMNNLTVKGTTNDKYSCKYSTDNKTWMDTKVVGTTTMDYIV